MTWKQKLLTAAIMLVLGTLLALLGAAAFTGPSYGAVNDTGPQGRDGSAKVNKTDEQWKKELSPEQYQVMRCSATEAPFTGKFYKHKETGIYVCAGCNAELFSSDTKYESGSGWPSYFRPISPTAITEKQDVSLGMVRTEILCSRCEAHLGHVFPDGPRPTGLRYCVNSISLDFKPSDGDPEE